MSSPLISRSDDLRRLRDEGYEVSITSGLLVITHVPYATEASEVAYGSLVSELTLSGNQTTRPGTHVVHFAGHTPCDHGGAALTKLLLEGQPPLQVSPGFVAAHMFSSKPVPPDLYPNYFVKMTTYINILGAQARAIDPDATAQTWLPHEDVGEDAIFCYIDTASSRVGIHGITAKLEQERLGLVGLGGTGGYILDLVAKTPVREIHLFDGDVFSQHNAFRAPGAATTEQLRQLPKKVDYLAEQYGAMRRGIVRHPYRVDSSNAHELAAMDFVFVAIDDAGAKEVIIDQLEAAGVPFIDVGMGIYEVDGSLAGLIRTTVSETKPGSRVRARGQISFGTSDLNDDYDRDIQVADLNVLNASLAVLAWKKLRGFYNNLDDRLSSIYVVDSNTIIGDGQP